MKMQSPPKPSWASSSRPTVIAAKIGISLLLVAHLTGMFIFPFAAATEFQSPAAMPIFRAMLPYNTAMYLDHGYAFFAPNPGASHLVRYKLEFADGREPIERTFPDIERHWPRLLYHRHFMLAEHLNANFVPPEPPLEANDREWKLWRERRDTYEKQWRSFENHLLETYQADKITMLRIEHEIPFQSQFERGLPLDKESLFVPLDQPQPRERGAEQ